MDTDDPRVGERLEKVHRILDDYKERFGSNVQAQQIERTTEYSMYGLSLYELGLLYEAGIPPWYGIAKVCATYNIVPSASPEIMLLRRRYSTWSTG